MPITPPIRHRLLTISVLGVFTASLSAAALYRVIALSTAQRVERAREAVGEEIATMTGPGADAERDLDGAPPAMIGMRGGIVRDAGAVATRTPADWRAPLADAAARAAALGRPADIDVSIHGATLVGRVQPADGGRLAWVAIAVRPSPYAQSWRLLVGALTISALLLVGSAGYALVTVKRGASAVQGALRALAHDLSAPVPRPRVQELAEIADGIATLARHLAESRQIQERLAGDLARQERLVALGRVVAGVAHEVRNPLASIKLRLDLAIAGDGGDAQRGDGDAGRGGDNGGQAPAAPLPAAVLQAIAHASAEITRLDRLVADLLIVSGRALGPRRALELGELLRARAEAMAPWSALRGVTIRTAGGGGVVAVDSDAIARAIDNLLRNAIEASPDGATVAATVHDEGDQIRVRVQDRGAGVPAARAGELFEPFFTTKAEGTGLGLAISRAIARAHGGDVTYRRDEEVTRFELTVPRAVVRAPAPAEAGLTA
jgi:signal transduction histidine kinase